MLNDDKRTPLGRKLIQLRYKQNIKSSATVARDLGINESTYRRYESEGTARRLGVNLGRIAEYFGVTVDYLLGREDEPQYESPENTTDETFIVRSVKAEYEATEDPGRLSDEEKIFVNLWRSLGERDQELVADLIESLQNKNKAD